MLDRTTPPPLLPYPELHLPDIEKTILPNGTEFYQLRAGDRPVNRITLCWNRGDQETSCKEALSLACLLLREGAGSRSGLQISETLDYHGAWLKIDSDEHNIILNLFSLNKATPLLLPLLGDIIGSPTFPEEAVSTMRDNFVAKRAVNLKKVSYVAALTNRRRIFGDNHKAIRLLSLDEIAALTREDIIRAYEATIKKCRPQVFVTGCFDDTLCNTLQNFFGTYPFANALPAPIITAMNPQSPGIVKETIAGAQQAAINISIPTINRTHPDYLDLRLTTMALGGYFGSRLMANIREEKGYTYGIQAGVLGYLEGGVINITSQTAPQYVEPLINETIYELNRLATEPMDNEELNAVKSSAITSLAGALDSPFTMLDLHLAKFTYGVADDYYAQQLRAIDNISPERICEIASLYLRPDKMLTTIVAPE